jgi:hypothetical protein
MEQCSAGPGHNVWEGKALATVGMQRHADSGWIKARLKFMTGRPFAVHPSPLCAYCNQSVSHQAAR